MPYLWCRLALRLLFRMHNVRANNRHPPIVSPHNNPKGKHLCFVWMKSRPLPIASPLKNRRVRTLCSVWQRSRLPPTVFLPRSPRKRNPKANFRCSAWPRNPPTVFLPRNLQRTNPRPISLSHNFCIGKSELILKRRSYFFICFSEDDDSGVPLWWRDTGIFFSWKYIKYLFFASGHNCRYEVMRRK